MNPELIQQISFNECMHRNQKVILCTFPYKPELLKEFRNSNVIRSAQSVFRNAMIKAGINKSSGIHGLRHSYATHLLEAGTDMVFIQKLPGYNHIKTTEIYAKVSNRMLSNIQSPLDTL